MTLSEQKVEAPEWRTYALLCKGQVIDFVDAETREEAWRKVCITFMAVDDLSLEVMPE